MFTQLQLQPAYSDEKKGGGRGLPPEEGPGLWGRLKEAFVKPARDFALLKLREGDRSYTEIFNSLNDKESLMAAAVMWVSRPRQLMQVKDRYQGIFLKP